MANFPTLTSCQPHTDSWREQKAADPAIRSKSEGGYTKTRARYTRAPKSWKFYYAALSPADKSTLEGFETTVKVGSDSFTWTNPATGTSFTVRFTEPIKFSTVFGKNSWKAELSLEEV